jgi:hypothetical protein
MGTPAVVGGVKRRARDGLLGCTEVVDGSVETHVRLHVDTFSQVRHDLVDTGFEVLPSVSY